MTKMALESPNVAIRVPEQMQIKLPDPPAGALWVRNGFVVSDWIVLAEDDWFWLDTVSPINPAW